MFAKVLQYYPKLQDAGTEMVIMNWWKNIDHSKIQFDFLCRKEGLTSSDFAILGAKIYYVDATDNAEYEKLLEIFFSSHPEYQILHVHNCAEQDIVLRTAKRCGVKNRIIHSHVARPDLPFYMQWAKAIKDIPLELYANHFLACSSWAVKWLFPHRKKVAQIVQNAIELDKFRFNNNLREQYRREFNIHEDEILVLSVGRFAKQKNQKFSIKVAECVHNRNSKFKFVFIGDGPQMSELIHLAKSLRTDEYVTFAGHRRNVNEILSAADIFISPSKYEGLGITMIESQASGLPTLSSDRVPPEADLGIGLFKVLPLKQDSWVNTILTIRPCDDRTEKYQEAIRTDYNIERIAHKMEEYYLNLL